jgi:hypothetical protein
MSYDLDNWSPEPSSGSQGMGGVLIDHRIYKKKKKTSPGGRPSEFAVRMGLLGVGNPMQAGVLGITSSTTGSSTAQVKLFT